MTIAQMLARLRRQIAEQTTARNLLTVALEGMRDLEDNDENRAAVAAKRGERDAIDAELRSLTERATALEVAEAEERAANQAADQTQRTGAPLPHYDQQHRTGAEPRTYTEQSCRQGTSFFSDAFNFTFSADPHARERLERHGQESRADMTERAASTTSFAGLVVPQYLVDQAALMARAGRPTANVVTHLELPDEGMALIIPKATTGVSAAVQSAENTAVSNTDTVMTNITVPVATIAGQQDVSRQSLERGTPGIDGLIYMDLAAAYAVALDQQVLFGTGSAGQMLGIYNTAGVNQASAFTAAATTQTFYTKTAGQLNAVETLRFMAPDVIVMHPRRWNWLLTQVDSSNRPLVVPNQNGPFNALGVSEAPIDTPSVVPVGSMFGLPVITDASVQTAVGSGPEDITYVMRKEDLLLWEDGDGMPRQLRFEQTTGGSLTTKLVAYGYAAFTAARYPTAVGLVGGNSAAGFGLIAPTF
jgi:HK97 family phage major capsid protein